MQDIIERSLELPHPPSRVWRALTDPARFGAWFGVAMEGPFALGQPVAGRFTIPGHEHVRFACEVVEWIPETVFAWRWSPLDPEAGADPLSGPCTLVRFEIAPTAAGARLTVVESGFAALPVSRAQEALRSNARGWDFQFGNIERFLAGESADA